MSHTCSTCTHWHPRPKPTPPPGAAVMLSAKEEPARGECRCMPPTANVLHVHQGNQLAAIQQAVYPLLPEGFPACAQHQLRLEG